jgi:hypothetical protein
VRRARAIRRGGDGLLPAIALAAQRADEVLALRAERAPQLGDLEAQRVVRDGDVRPHALDDLLARQEPSRVVEKEAAAARGSCGSAKSRCRRAKGPVPPGRRGTPRIGRPCVKSHEHLMSASGPEGRAAREYAARRRN